MDKLDIKFFWLWIGFCVILAIGASIAWYAHWSDNWAYVVIGGLYTIYLIVFRLLTKE
ncbi:hypothetical protein ACFLWL_00250 [Chloroflexota bacterium]